MYSYGLNCPTGRALTSGTSKRGCVWRRGSLQSRSGQRRGFPGASGVKTLSANAGDTGDRSLGGEGPLGRKWQPTPVFSLGESHGQRSLVGHSPRGRKRVRHGRATDTFAFSK